MPCDNEFMLYANNKGAYQSAHPRSLISAVVARFLDSMIHVHVIAVFRFSRTFLVNVAEQAGLSIGWIEFLFG